MPSDHQDSWTPLMVALNTGATLLAACSGIAALVIACIALFG
ncbi:hypothetical protein LCGC14_0289360 [marine sediment metagenome]|uniref:Uncharacterized protein n=1 Tax=marine sediment metagenome TaxID=412755 RepID=A0A0F9TYT4_9ZZZZ